MLCRRAVPGHWSITLDASGLILVGVAILLIAGVVYGFFTRSGSGIDEHPIGGEGGAPGAEGRSEVSGQDQGEGSALDQHGTR